MIGVENTLSLTYFEKVLLADEKAEITRKEVELWEVSLGNLLRMQLVQLIRRAEFPTQTSNRSGTQFGMISHVQLEQHETYAFTGLGLAFVRACRRASQDAGYAA